MSFPFFYPLMVDDIAFVFGKIRNVFGPLAVIYDGFFAKIANAKSRQLQASEFASLQESILGSLSFNLFINHLFVFVERISTCNFAHNNAIYRCEEYRNCFEDLQHDIKTLLNWFKTSFMKPNPKTFQFIIHGKASRLLAIAT